jgi:hypothetical protein
LLVFANADEEAVLRRSGNHVAVQHKAQAAEHPHFPHRTGSSESGAHALGEIFIQSHGLARKHVTSSSIRWTANAQQRTGFRQCWSFLHTFGIRMGHQEKCLLRRYCERLRVVPGFKPRREHDE